MYKKFCCAYLLFLAFLLTASTTFAATGPGYVPIAGNGIPGLTDQSSANAALTGSFAVFFNNLYTFCIGIAVLLAVIMIVWGGVQYATTDNISNKSEGKKHIWGALFGLVLVLSPAVVFSIINPAILNLNVNIPALSTTWGNFVPPSPSPVPVVGTPVGPGAVVASSDMYPCSDEASCATAKNTCYSRSSITETVMPTLVCTKSGGAPDDSSPPNNYSCPSGESLNIYCFATVGTGVFP